MYLALSVNKILEVPLWNFDLKVHLTVLFLTLLEVGNFETGKIHQEKGKKRKQNGTQYISWYSIDPGVRSQLYHMVERMVWI